MFLKAIAFFLLVSHFAASHKVLMVLPLGSPSHKNIFIPLADKLVKDGNDVELVSLHKSKGATAPLYTDVAASETRNYMEKLHGDMNIFKLMGTHGKENVNSQIMKKVLKLLPLFCEAFLNDPAVQESFNSRPDLILLPAFINECALILVEKFKVPFIYVTTSGLTPWTADLVGNPEHPAFVPNQYLPYTDQMTLWQRTVNSITRVVSPMLRDRFILSRLDTVAQKYLQKSRVSLAAVEKNVSMIFVNSHVSLGFPRPLQPNVIEIGGMHCNEAKDLERVDPELKEFLDSADNGAILFSLGSQIQSSQMPSYFKDMLISAFSKIPYKIVWKWEDSQLLNVSENVLIRPWLPQQDVLGHPSVKAFFTHGGLLSTQEAVYHGVPLVGLPMMSDQPLNVKQAENLGFAVRLDYATLTEDELISALRKVIEDKNYQTNAKQRSTIMRDQESHPLDRAFYWTKYVLRHNGALHLRSSSASISTSQFLLLDVIGVIILMTVAFFVVVYIALKMIWMATKKLILMGLQKMAVSFKNHSK